MDEGTVLVAYPHPATQIEHSFAVSLMALVNHDAANHQRLFSSTGPLMMRCGTGGLVNARNEMVRHFLDDSNEEWLWMVDTDMGFAADTVDRLVEAADPELRPVVGALCFGLKQGDPDGYGGYLTAPFPTIYGWERGENGNAGFRTADDYPPDTLLSVAGTGAACLLMHRSALQRVRDNYGDEWFVPVKYPDGRFLSEDLSLCYRFGVEGIPIHVHTGVKTTHAKQIWVGEQHFRAHRALGGAQLVLSSVEAVSDRGPDRAPQVVGEAP